MSVWARIGSLIGLLCVASMSQASAWEHEVNSHGVCIVHNEDMSWPFIVLGFYSDTSEIAIFNPDWKSIEDGREYSLDWNFSSGDEWALTFRGFVSDNGTVALKGSYSKATADEFMADFIKADSYQLIYNNTVLAEQSLAGSMKAYYRAIECRRAKDPFEGEGNRGNDPFKPSRSNDPFSS